MSQEKDKQEDFRLETKMKLIADFFFLAKILREKKAQSTLTENHQKSMKTHRNRKPMQIIFLNIGI